MASQVTWSQALKSLKASLFEGGNADDWKMHYLALLTANEDISRVSASDPKDVVKSLLFNLSRGYSQIRAAQHWKSPIIGNVDQPSVTDYARGQIWRFLIGYSGWECCAKNLKIYQVPQEALFDSKIFLPPPSLTPGQRSALIRWSKAYASESDLSVCCHDPDEILDFLGITAKGYRPFPGWLIGRSTSITQPQILAVMRNIVAHGALSPSKANQWGMTGLYEKGSALFYPLFNRLLSKLYGE